MKKTDEALFPPKNLVLPQIAQTCPSTFLKNGSWDSNENVPKYSPNNYLTAHENRMSKKILFSRYSPKRAQKSPKMRFFQLFSKMALTIFLKTCQTVVLIII